MIRVHVNAEGMDDAPVGLLERGLRATLEAEGHDEGELSLTLLDDDGIRDLNRAYLDRDRSTDVIAFRLHDAGDPVLGDVYVGLGQARRQADEHGVALEEELLRLAVHGTLHVLGHDHPDDETREESPMYRRQEELVGRILDEDGP